MMLPGYIPWPEDRARAYRAKGYWADITLYEMLAHAAKARPDKIALVYESVHVTYADFVDRVDRLAAQFLLAGLRPRERVVFQVGNSLDFFYAYFALLKVGVIPVMSLPAHRQTEIRHFVAHAQATAYLIPDKVRDFDYRPMAEEIKGYSPSLAHIFVAGEPGRGQKSIGALAETPIPPGFQWPARPDPADVALMLLSGGTTALPKLIPRTHNDYVLNCRLAGKMGGLDSETVMLVALPLAHNFTLASPGVQAVLDLGGRVVIAPKIDAETTFPLIEKEKVTYMPLAIPLATAYLNSEVPDRYDTSSLKLIAAGGAKLAPELRKRLIVRFKVKYQESFGTAEGLLNYVPLDASMELVLNSSGRPCCEDDEIKVLDDFDKEVPDGKPGELVVRGPYTINGYYNAPDINAKAFTADGFYRMGDVVIKQGRDLFYQGRKKDLINRGGEKISCEEVENHILAHPKVQSACLVAMPDPDYGEKGCVFVIPRPGENLTFKELVDFLMTRQIAKFKLPERMEIVDSFPLSPAGKILRRTLREIIAEKLSTETAR